MPLGPFVPAYVLPNELTLYDLPAQSDYPSIMSLVNMASLLIDEECGRYDGDGNGSLVFTTYMQRLLLQTRNRNLVYLPMKPIVPVTASAIVNLTGLAATGANYYYTGVQPYVYNGPFGSASGILAASGRYGYTRQDMSVA